MTRVAQDVEGNWTLVECPNQPCHIVFDCKHRQAQLQCWESSAGAGDAGGCGLLLHMRGRSTWERQSAAAGSC